MSDVLLPGGRDVRGRLEEPDAKTQAVVVACPPHPQHGGSRTDRRLVAVSDALTESGIACLRFDYGPWDEGYGEREDVRNAVRWAADDDRFERIGLFGYSFGASQALLASASVDRDVAAVAALAPTATLGEGLDAVEALSALEAPLLVLYGERDTTVDWEPVVDRATDRGDDVSSLAGDHFFLGKHGAIASEVAAFFERTLPA
ncbi:alpha/beta hydrolase [Halosolutus halophilus]|uniref:alpha/beta hydrolase n=1 Tax=Halosolutus halophilus TaxID=1552990 RepID=UPI0022350FCA|nr:dienelactone hydrolase family protein [Halosolutus halophilus]